MSAPDALERAKADALALLDKRAFARAGLVERLVRKGHDEGVAAQAADAMERLGLIDDRAMARDLVERELERTPAARALLERRLAARRLDPDAAHEVIEGALAGRDPLEDALDAARALRAKMPENLDAPTLLRRLSGRLARRGYDEEVALEAARRAIGATDEGS